MNSVQEENFLNTESINSLVRSEVEHENWVWYRKKIGLVFILLFICNAIAQSEYTQYFEPNIDFHNNYFLNWICNAMLFVVWPLYIVCEFVILKIHRHVSQDNTLSFSEYWQGVNSELSQNLNFSWKRYIFDAIWVNSINYWSSYGWFVSLPKIPVSINTALNRLTFVFVVILSLLFLRLKLTYEKSAYIFFLIAGLVLIGYGNITDHSNSKTFSTSDKITGYLLVLFSTSMWAIYEVAFKKRFGDASMHAVLMIQSVSGLFFFLVFWIPIPFLIEFGISQPFDLLSRPIAIFVGSSVFFAVTYYVLVALAVAWSDPIYVTASGMISIPLAALTDFLLRGEKLDMITLSGMFVVIFAISLMLFYEYRQHLHLLRAAKRRSSLVQETEAPMISHL